MSDKRIAWNAKVISPVIVTTQKTVEGGLHLTAEAQGAWHLAMIQSGGYVLSEDGRRHEVSSGMARLSPPRATPSVQIERSGASCVTLDASGPFWARIFARALHGLRLETVVSRHSRAALTQTQALGDLRSIGRVLTMFWPETERSSVVEEARALIETGFRTISLSRLASDFGIPRGRFAALFLKATGFRPVEYRTLCRVAAAHACLSNTALTLAEIGAVAGFADQSHMTTNVGAVLGLSPMRVRSAASVGDSFSKDARIADA